MHNDKTYLKEFKKQKAYKSFNGYKIAIEMRKLSVLLLTIFLDMGEFTLHDPFNELHGKLSKKNGRVEYMYRRGTDCRYTSMKRQLTRREKRVMVR